MRVTSLGNSRHGRSGICKEQFFLEDPLSHSNEDSRRDHMLEIEEFIQKSSGLQYSRMSELLLKVFQRTDGKELSFNINELEDVIHRVDSDGQKFLQVNFHSGKKILITQNLIGFKPAAAVGLDMGRLPRVVTTPDLLSVVDAIEETLELEDSVPEELEVLKRVFDSVLRGGEDVGFDLTAERLWLNNLSLIASKASA